MTNEEAIRILNEQRNKFMDEWVDFGGVNEAYDMVIAMLKKQEPKEVKDKSTRIDFIDEYFEGECPSCRSFLDEHSNRNFCGYCGQAVKWE